MDNTTIVFVSILGALSIGLAWQSSQSKADFLVQEPDAGGLTDGSDRSSHVSGSTSDVSGSPVPDVSGSHVSGTSGLRATLDKQSLVMPPYTDLGLPVNANVKGVTIRKVLFDVFGVYRQQLIRPSGTDMVILDDDSAMQDHKTHRMWFIKADNAAEAYPHICDEFFKGNSRELRLSALPNMDPTTFADLVTTSASKLNGRVVYVCYENEDAFTRSPMIPATHIYKVMHHLSNPESANIRFNKPQGWTVYDRHIVGIDTSSDSALHHTFNEILQTSSDILLLPGTRTLQKQMVEQKINEATHAPSVIVFCVPQKEYDRFDAIPLPMSPLTWTPHAGTTSAGSWLGTTLSDAANSTGTLLGAKAKPVTTSLGATLSTAKSSSAAAISVAEPKETVSFDATEPKQVLLYKRMSWVRGGADNKKIYQQHNEHPALFPDQKNTCLIRMEQSKYTKFELETTKGFTDEIPEEELTRIYETFISECTKRKATTLLLPASRFTTDKPTRCMKAALQQTPTSLTRVCFCIYHKERFDKLRDAISLPYNDELMLPAVVLKPHGVLGNNNVPEDCVIVDSAGSHIGSAEANGVSGAIYNAINGSYNLGTSLLVETKQALSDGNKIATTKAAFAEYQTANQLNLAVIHVIAPDFGTLPFNDKFLITSYLNVFLAFCNLPAKYKTLRLLPISSGIFAGAYKDHILANTHRYVNEALKQLSVQKMTRLFDATLEMCAFMKEERRRLDGFD